METVTAFRPAAKNLLLWLGAAALISYAAAGGVAGLPAGQGHARDSLDAIYGQGTSAQAGDQTRLLVSAPALMPELAPREIVLPRKTLAPPALMAEPLIPPVEAIVIRQRNAKKVPIKPVKRHYRQLIHRAASRYGVDPAMIKAIIMAESGFNPKAVSRRGAQGLMQLMPQTAQSLGLADAFDPGENIDAGARYLRQLLNHFRGDIELALAAYNAGIQNVIDHNGVPPFKATRRYVRRVLIYYEHYKRTLTG